MPLLCPHPHTLSIGCVLTSNLVSKMGTGNFVIGL